jgi:predicted transcriptional regulator
MSEDLAREHVLQAVDRLVEELLDRAGVTGPPVDAIALAQRHLGMSVSPGRRQPQRGRGRGSLNPEPTEEQRQWTVAHEVGERFKADLLRRLGVESEQTHAMAGASLANLFAAHLLVPACWFAADAPVLDYDVLELKKRYLTSSHEVVALRFLDLPQPCVVTVLDNGHVTRRKSNAWRVTRQLQPAEQECQRYVHHYSRPRVVREGGWTVQGWPVHQADWKREILRSVLDEDA